MSVLFRYHLSLTGTCLLTRLISHCSFYLLLHWLRQCDHVFSHFVGLTLPQQLAFWFAPINCGILCGHSSGRQTLIHLALERFVFRYELLKSTALDSKQIECFPSPKIACLSMHSQSSTYEGVKSWKFICQGADSTLCVCECVPSIHGGTRSGLLASTELHLFVAISEMFLQAIKSSVFAFALCAFKRFIMRCSYRKLMLIFS